MSGSVAVILLKLARPSVSLCVRPFATHGKLKIRDATCASLLATDTIDSIAKLSVAFRPFSTQ